MASLSRLKIATRKHTHPLYLASLHAFATVVAVTSSSRPVLEGLSISKCRRRKLHQ